MFPLCRIAILAPMINICARDGQAKFTMRGKPKVNAHWNLYCMVHNIGKIMRYSLLFAKHPA